MAAAWVEALDKGLLNPPRDIHDAAGWNSYWTNQLRVGAMEQGFSDTMSSDDELVEILDARRVRTILCAGNGFSGEALSLALHGFDVTMLDISHVPAEVMAAALRNHEYPVASISGLRIDGTAAIFDGEGEIPADICPRIHRTPIRPPRCGGRLAFAIGDFTDLAICPGPFDAVIERRTLQLFPEAEREPALQRLVGRLAERGLFVSHIHDGCGPRNDGPRHPTEWMTSRGFVVDSRLTPAQQRAAVRLARTRYTTG